MFLTKFSSDVIFDSGDFFSVKTFSGKEVFLTLFSSEETFLISLFLLGFSILALGFSLIVSPLEGDAACMSRI